MSEARPYSKEAQLARSEPRYRRKVASRKEWERIKVEKMGPCRVCSTRLFVDPHHIVLREHGGDDLPENVAPVCRDDHAALHNRAPAIVRLFLSRLTDAEYAYAVGKAGEDYFERAYGLEYAR